MKMKVGFFDVAFLAQIFSCVCFHADDRDYYAVLNVKRSAKPLDIKKAYKVIMFKLHPDKNKCDPHANEKTDERKRQDYNRRHPMAGLYTTGPYDWDPPECSGKNMDAGFSYTKHIRNNAVLGMQWVLGIAANIVYIMRGVKLNSFQCGTFLAVTASFVSRSPVILFILLWIFVVDRLHFILMIWMSAEYIKNIRIKYLPYLVLIWIIYFNVVDQYDIIFHLGLSFWTVYDLYNFPTLLIFYSTGSVLVTIYIFLKYKPHQSHHVQYIVYFLQQALAFYYLSETIPNEADLNAVLLYHLTMILISKLFSKYVWLYVRSSLHDLYTFSRGILERKSAFILSTLKKFVQLIIRKFGCVQIIARMWALCTVHNFQEIWSRCNHFCHQVWTKCVQTSIEMWMKCVHTCHSLPNLANSCGKYICNRLKTWFLSIVSTNVSYYKTKILQLCRLNHGTVKSRQPLSNAEYVMEGRFYTLVQLNQLRLDCLEMRVNAWRMANVLSNVKRFSNFVLGENHVTSAEIEEHRHSSRIYPQLDPIATDSESSSENDEI
ncbi:uncharacterized protein LOC133199687 [Saccostrea echinata]|uniref:uncharacterized protein LOC133199687 n=1 Tax=Saccostrea echinata TaxID=191078 RepID=UPI002A7EB0F2|nr:uncharacterized protein LOC133199687 [Saccostrea echinata]